MATVLSARGGILIRDSDRCTIQGAILSGIHSREAAIECVASRNVQFVGVSVFVERIAALSVRRCRHVSVYGSRLLSSGAPPVIIEGSEGVLLDGM